MGLLGLSIKHDYYTIRDRLLALEAPSFKALHFTIYKLRYILLYLQQTYYKTKSHLSQL